MWSARAASAAMLGDFPEFLETLPVLSFGAIPIPFVEHLGFTLHKMENGESELRYEAQPDH
jgi:acyl-coenzyme A thioesterase PaaI-like protein